MAKRNFNTHLVGYNSVDALDDLLKKLQSTFGKSEGFYGEVDMVCKMGCVYDASTEAELHRVSYNLYITIDQVPFVVIHYELDRRFSLELSERVIDRIHNLLSQEAIFTISIYGFCGLVAARRSARAQIVMHTVKESEDKGFMSIN